MTQRFKLLLVGDAQVGKTAYVSRLINKNNFVVNYVPTLGVDVYPVLLSNGFSDVIFDIWDIAGQYPGMSDAYFMQTHCAIIMYSLDNLASYQHIQSHIDKIHNLCGDIPIFICGNKSDIPYNVRTVTENKYLVLSIKNNDNIILPLAALLSMLLHNSTYIVKSYELGL